MRNNKRAYLLGEADTKSEVDFEMRRQPSLGSFSLFGRTSLFGMACICAVMGFVSNSISVGERGTAAPINSGMHLAAASTHSGYVCDSLDTDDCVLPTVSQSLSNLLFAVQANVMTVPALPLVFYMISALLFFVWLQPL